MGNETREPKKTVQGGKKEITSLRKSLREGEGNKKSAIQKFYVAGGGEEKNGGRLREVHGALAQLMFLPKHMQTSVPEMMEKVAKEGLTKKKEKRGG